MTPIRQSDGHLLPPNYGCPLKVIKLPLFETDVVYVKEYVTPKKVFSLFIMSTTSVGPNTVTFLFIILASSFANFWANGASPFPVEQEISLMSCPV